MLLPNKANSTAITSELIKLECLALKVHQPYIFITNISQVESAECASLL